MKNIKRFAGVKIYLDRARTYLSYVQLVMVVKLFATDIGIESNYIIGIGLILCTVAFIVIGWLDTKLGIRKSEYENQSLQNPILVEILNKIKKIEETQNETNNK